MYEDAETKSRQTLLRYQAIKIADYEALYHTGLWNDEPEPNYIYYIGQSKHFETWYKNIKKEGGIIYKDFEEKCSFTKHVCKNADYDNISIWKYKYEINEQVHKTEAHIEVLDKMLKNIPETERASKEVLLKKLSNLIDFSCVHHHAEAHI